MVTDQLVKYVREEKNKGFTYHQIEKVLLDSGYSQDEVDEAIQRVEGVSTNAYQPTKKIKELKKTPKKQQKEETRSTDEIHSTKPLQHNSKYPVRKRKIWHVITLSILLFWAYPIYWLIDTSRELHKNTGSPNPWMILINLIPFAWFYFYYKYVLALQELTGTDKKTVIYLLLCFLPVVGVVFVQIELNKVATF